MTLSSIFSMRVHCWGGLGSQLYALATAHDLKARFPKRKIILVLHSAGVTSRSSELSFINNLEFEIVNVNDFKPRNKDFSSQRKRPVTFASIIKKFLILVGLVSTANSSSDYKKIKPWVISLRGHYFYRPVSPSFYSYLLNYIDKFDENMNKRKANVSLHYRMGDLLKLEEKSIVPVNRITEVVLKVLKQYDNVEFHLFSDSPKEATKLLMSAGIDVKITVHDLPAIEVIRSCYKSDFFIGTNSKISLWIVNLRRYSGISDANYLEGFDDKLYNHALESGALKLA